MNPEMHQTKKGNQWYHGMKIYAGVDAGSSYVLPLQQQPQMFMTSKKHQS